MSAQTRPGSISRRKKKHSSKNQARDILQALYAIKASDAAWRSGLGYLVADLDPVAKRGTQKLEHELLFGSSSSSQGALMHNGLSQSNLIVDRGKIVAVVDWRWRAGLAGISLGRCICASEALPKNRMPTSTYPRTY